MNINRHNYETFFLLYVDNELSPAERKAVDQFVQENTDLAPELQLLLETTLPSETINFHTKEQLYKNEAGLAAMQENLLLHLDNELDPFASQEMAEAISSDNALLHEWKILQQTKLDANEKIVFGNKQVLYRHERDRVISIRFWRVAVAAAILLACLFTTISLLKKEGPVKDVAVKGIIKPSTGKQDQNNNKRPDQHAVDPLQTTVPGNTALAKEQVPNNTTSTAADKTNEANEKKQVNSNDQLITKEKNILPKTSLENINKEGSNETIASAVINKNSETISTNKIPVEIANKTVKEKITAPETPVIDYNSIPVKNENYAKTAVLEESSRGDGNKILYMNEENVARSRIGGLFRKVKRIIERNTNIKTGNGVKIAGFEFAVK
ncbi:MAG: hypothetical protein ABI741_09365 [Ferruginibacter sp.]